MGGGEDGWAAAPSGGPMKDDHWTHFDNSVNAVSFGFVATAILISMFLVMAIFEKLLRTTSPAITPAGVRPRADIEAGNHIGGFNAKLGGYPSPKVSTNYCFLGLLHFWAIWSIFLVVMIVLLTKERPFNLLLLSHFLF